MSTKAPPEKRKPGTRRQARRTIAKLLAAVDRSITAAEHIKRARDDLSKLAARSGEGGTDAD